MTSRTLNTNCQYKHPSTWGLRSSWKTGSDLYFDIAKATSCKQAEMLTWAESNYIGSRYRSIMLHKWQRSCSAWHNASRILKGNLDNSKSKESKQWWGLRKWLRTWGMRNKHLICASTQLLVQNASLESVNVQRGMNNQATAHYFAELSNGSKNFSSSWLIINVTPHSYSHCWLTVGIPNCDKRNCHVTVSL